MRTRINILMLFLAVAFVNNSIGQVSLTNTGTLYVSGSSDILYVNGAFTNNSGSALTNNGSLYVRQTLTNNQSSMAAGSGTLYLNGTTAQNVNGSQAFRTYNLVTDNTAGITLSNNLNVAGAHTFTNGLIASSSTPNYLVYEAGSSYTGSGDTKHVSGWVKKIGTTDFIFPVGDANYLRTIAISSLSGSGEFNCQYNTPTQNIYNLFSPLVQVKSNEYWQLDKVTGGNATVTVNWDNSKVAMDNILLKDILVGKYFSGNWTNAGGEETAVGLVTTTGYVSSTPVTVFGQFTLGYKTFPVPLQMLSFTATRRNGVSYLQWVTDNEQSVSHFEIQRSSDAANFTTIGRVNARNHAGHEEYNYEDYSAIHGIAWYRIRSVDVDGKLKYSKIAAVSELNTGAGSFVVINPVRTSITAVNKSGHDGNFAYRLYTSAGQLVLQGTSTIGNNAAASISLPAQITSGVYLLEIANDNIQFRQKVMVEK